MVPWMRQDVGVITDAVELGTDAAMDVVTKMLLAAPDALRAAGHGGRRRKSRCRT
ncbi:hypothetical protein PF002_g31073 [Phytophthora fragariae]|uniref:Uncharacterized protein n=1 Tax=Phytophthora fragariae TaxID=53985 RepID=A0A6A3DAF9_9STRA|nr:hypothetical protein PF003_g34324 [Phytophthora fragariae]KAE8886456.1 hypothetical protein PF003_g29640 [Phytophthora fragariae]KAE8918419.1 hypothetical protein PF009_g31265 [Phytophthora fragariae]KAE9064880.1 hypothetical protein PF006_g30581 [Phytophthora fragariae]KAE9166597.1 hypothetical protein PF002_g31073 [Phytophthora fragariae]